MCADVRTKKCVDADDHTNAKLITRLSFILPQGIKSCRQL